MRRESLDRAIPDHVKKNLNLAIGEKMAEEIKIQIGSAVPVEDELKNDDKGAITSRDSRAQLNSPKRKVRAMAKELRTMVGAIKDVLQETPRNLPPTSSTTDHHDGRLIAAA